MTAQQIINNLISNAPDNKLDIILLHEDDKINNSLLSEPSLSKGLMCANEVDAWKDL